MPLILSDTHFHGPIGFQRFLIDAQSYRGQNHLQSIIDHCIARNIGMCAITSEEFNIKKGSIHDRFGYLLHTYADKLPQEYKLKTIGDNILLADKGRKRVRLINSQTVIIRENSKRLDHLVLFSNQVPNLKALTYTLDFGKDQCLTQIAEHPLVLMHFGIGASVLIKNLEGYDAIEGHNSQLALNPRLCFLPSIGQYTKSANETAKRIARDFQKPYTASSDGHRIEDVGCSNIVLDWPFDHEEEEKITEGEFKSEFRKIIRNGKFKTNENYISLFSFIKSYHILKKYFAAVKVNPALNEEPEIVPATI